MCSASIAADVAGSGAGKPDSGASLIAMRAVHWAIVVASARPRHSGASHMGPREARPDSDEPGIQQHGIASGVRVLAEEARPGMTALFMRGASEFVIQQAHS